MSGEQLTSKVIKTHNNLTFDKSKNPPRVNINNLLYRVRSEKIKEKRENYVFLGLVVGVLAVTGIIASL